jgi:hypothetical protein
MDQKSTFSSLPSKKKYYSLSEKKVTYLAFLFFLRLTNIEVGYLWPLDINGSGSFLRKYIEQSNRE